MDRYLNNCYKAARAASSKAAASSLTANREQYDSLYQPSYDFNLSDPYCWLLQTSYKSLHNPHLKSYCRRKDILRRLKKDGYVTSNNKKMIEKQVNKLYETKRACDSHGNTQFQEWLLQENKQTTPDQELLIKQRYLDMISLELNKLEHMAEKQNVLWIKEEERRHRDHIRGKLGLWRQIEEKKAQLEKKITYYLQKMQRNDLQREGSEENVFENKSQDETEGERETIKDKEITTLQSPGVSAKTPSICRYSLQDTSKQQVTCADLNGEKAKKSSLNYEPAPGVSFIHDSPIRRDYHPNRSQEKVTSEELNSIIQNVMTWVVAAVTSVLYPAITKYEERLQNITCPMPDNSTLSSDSESCCGTCCETFLYETSKMVQAEPCTEAADRSIEQPVASSKSSFARKERTDVETTYHRKEHLENKPKAPKPKYNEISESPNLKTCKSDSHPVVQIETDTRKCKDATTETDSLECPLSSDEKAKAINEMQELNNVFVNFKHHLKEEAELILRNIFQEMVSELTQTIPSVTTESLPTQTDTDKGDLLSNVDISSAAAEIMGNVLEKLQSAVKKTCTEEFSPENISVHFKPDLVSGEYFISPKEKTSEVSLPYALENMNDVAEDMVHVILEKLMVLASSKQSELAHLKITTDPASQQHREDPTYTFLQRASKRKSSAKTDAASLIGKEEIRNLVSTVCSQSSLVGYIKEAISTVLGYIQVGLHNERLVATEETVIILQLLDALLAQLHQKPVKTDVRKSGHSRMSSPSGTEERNRLTRTGVAGAPRCGSLFPPINVPGVVLYSEDKNEEIDRIVENVLISSIKDEKAKLQEQVPDYWLTGENADFKHKRNMNLPTKPAYGHKVAFHDQGLNTDLPTFNKDPLKDKPGLNKDILLFSQDETYQIEKASEDIIRSILAKMFKDLSSGPSDHSDYEDGREASLLTSRKPQDPSHQESMDQMFSVSEIHTVSQDIVDDILKILHITSLHIIEHSSVHQTSLDNADVPNKESLQIWFDSKRNMKFLSALSVDPTKLPWVESGTSGSTSESVDNLNDKIINTIFKKLNSFICPKLQTCFKPESRAAHSKPAPDKKSSFRSHLSTFTTKVVKIVLDAIQKELQHNRENLNVRKDSPPKNFRDTGFFADAENELDSVVTKLNNDIMTSSLATCICEVLSGNTDKSNILLPSDKLRSKISHGTDGIDQQKLLPSHCPRMQEEVHQCTRFQVLDRIGDALYDMLCKLTGDHPHSPLSDEQNTEGINKNLRTTSTLQSNIKLISHTILEGIVSKLCGVETDSIFKNSEFKAISEHIDTDSPSFALLLEEMSRCYEIISSIASNVTWPGSQEVTNKGKTTAPKTGTTKEKHLNKLKTLASDIFEMVFAKLEGFANRNLENLGAIICGNKKNRTYCESENTNICGNTHEKRLQSTLYRHAKKVSSTILKVLQTELNMNLPDSETCISKPLQEKQILKSLVNFILDAISPDMFNEPEPEEKGMENYRYRPIYGNFLPGGADPDSYLEDPADTEKESAGEERPAEDETKSDSLKQQELEKTLKTFEVELKEPKNSPVVPIVRNILNEIFQNDLIGQLKVFTLPQSHLCDIPHADDEPFAQTSVQSLDETVGPLVSEADVTIVADDVVRTIFQKLHSAAMTDRNQSENRYNTITFPADISFPKHTQGGKSPVYSTILDRNPCTLQSTFNIGKLTKINVVEDIVQSILTNLEAFATSKVKALFCPHISFTVPVALPSQQDEIALQQPWLSTKDSHSEDQFSCCSMDHSKSGKTTSICQLSASKLNMYATEVARQILQGIKHKLDQDISPFLTQSVVAFESIPSQVVSTVLDIVSTKGKYEKNVFDRETDPVAPEDIIEKLFNKSDYRKKLQFQILDTIEGILIDICEETIDENNLPLAISTLKSNISGRHLETKPERDPRYANKAILTLLVPKECVAMISNDMVDIVLQNLTSAIMVRISANDSISPRLSTAFSDAFSKAEHQQSPIKDSVNGRAERQQPLVTDSVKERAKRKQPPVIDSVNERKRERFPFARKGRDVQLKSALSDDNQTTVLKKQDAKNSAPDPCKENAHFITKTILNRLKSFATERIDWLLILHPETREKPDVGSEFTNCKQNGSVFLESNQTPLDVTVPKIPTAGNILNQEVTNYTLAHYRENHRPAIHISQASLKEYADLIANTILTLIKNDIDLEIQKMYTYQNNTSFQENIIASETIKNILKSLCNKISLKASGFYSKQDPDLVTQLAVQNEIVPGQRKMEDNTKLSLFSKYSGENQKTPEMENQRRTLEEIFRNGEPGQEKTNSLLSVVKEILKKAYQRVLENTEHCSPFSELPHFTSDSKMKTSARKKALQSHISSVANDIVESVYTKIFLVIMTSLYENSERGEMEASGSDGLLMNPSCFRELKQAEKSSVPPKPVIPEVHPYTGIGSVSSLENTLLQFSPLRLGEHLVQKVLKKITDFALLNLEKNSSPKGQSDEILRPCNSKASPKGSPRASVKTNFKTKSKVTSLSKFGTKPQVGPSGAKAQSKTKLGPREKTLKGSWSKTSVGLPHLLSIGEAKNPSLRAKLPTAELKMYARDILHNILQTIVNEFEEVRQNRAVANENTLLSDQIERASGIVSAVLQGLHAMKNNLANPIKGSHSDDLKLPWGYFSTTSVANPEAHFSLETVSSQLDKLFPKEDIFKQMYDKWQTESSNMDNEKYKLLVIAEAVLNVISTKAKELEQSVSLLSLSLLEPCESSHHLFKRAASRVEDSQAQINIFGQEIIKKLFEKLELCFLTQMFTMDSKEILQSKKETAARRKCGSSRTNNLKDVPTYNTKLKDKTLGIAGHQITQILEGVLNTLESFVDLQFKHVSTYAFSEIVRTPIENFFAVQQKPAMKTIFPKLQTLTTFPDESKSSSMISQENIHNALQQLYLFHSELLTYAVNTVTDMLSIIKNKLDKEKCHKEPSSTSIFEENIVASQIISTLIDQCTYFYELMIKSHPKENLLQGAKNPCTVNCSRFTTGLEMSTSKSKGISCWDDPPQISGLLSYSEEDMKIKDKTSLDVPSYVRYSIGDSTKTIESMEGLESEFKPSSSRSEAQAFGHSDQAVKGDYFLPEGTVLPISSQKSSDSAQAALEHPMSFRETEEGENQRALHYEPLKPVVNPDEIQTTISPLKISLAAEDIVNTMLTSFGLSNQTSHSTENMETMKPFYISKEMLHCLTPEQLKNEKSLLKIWEKRNSYGTEEENKGLVASGEDSILLEKWKNKYPKLEKTLEEPGVIAFADCELGPHEVHLVARYVTTSVVTHFNNFETRDECPNWDTDSGKTARKMFLSSNNPQRHRIPRNNLGLSPKSAFLLNVVCEKLIRTLLEECTTNNFLTNSPLSDEISTERQLFNTLQSIDDYSSLTMDCGLPFEEYDMSDLFENLAEIDQESMLSIISHSLVKSLMEKLSCSIQQPPRSPPVTDKHLTYRTSERPPSFPKAKRPELKESKQSKNSVRFMSYDSKLLTGPSNNLRVIHSKMQTPFSKQFSGKLPSLPPLRRPDKKAIAFLNIRYPGGMNTGVYSATFLEEIIADIFLNLTTSLQGKNVTITEAQLNETNILDINCVVNEFNTAQVTVLRDIEEKMCFPPVYKETVSKIVDSVYNDVSWDYTFQVTCSDHLVYAAMSIAEQITSGILKESIDYQLPLCFIRKLMPNSYYPLKAENILLKLQNNLSELNYQSQHSTGYITMLSYSFLADVIRRLLSQLIPPPSEASCLGSKYLKTSDFNEVSTCIINKVLLAISKHKIWLTKYDCQCVYTEQNLQNMVESIYNNILQMSDSLGSIQKSIESQSPIIVDRMASLIIQEIIEHHLQPFLCEDGLPHSMSPLDEISNMVKEVLGEVTGSRRPQKSSSLGIRFYPNAFVEEIVARLLSKIFNPKYNMESDLDKMTPKIVNSINNHFKKAKIFILHDDQEQPFPTIDTDTMDELVNSVYKNVLKQHGLAVDSKEIKDSDIFAENITNLIVAAISDYLFHPLFSGDLSASSYTILTAENIIQNIFRGITKPTQPSQHLSPYNTLLPYTFLEEIIRELLSRIFPSASNLVPYSKTPKDRSEINHSEISSKLISDIRMKISQHEIRFSKDEDETESIYSEDDVQRLVDSTLRNIGQNSGSQEAVEHYITSSDNVFIDRIASFIIKNICQQHLHPFLYGKLPFTSSYRYFDSTRRRHSFFASVYPSAFLEDVISGVLSKIFHRALGIVQTKSLRDSEKELLETAEKFIYLITEEFSKVQVSTLENAEEQLCLPPVDRDIVIKMINTAYSKVLQEYELQPNKDFFSDTKTLAERLTKIILAEVFDFQIPPYFIAKLPFKSYSKLNADVLIKRVHYAINTSRLRRQTCTTYTTILSHTHLEKIVTQVLSQICLLNCSAEDPYFLQSDFNNTVVRLIDEIMSIISKHAICIIKDGNEKQSVISENSIQAMVDAIYTDISHLKLYQSVSKDKKGISNIPVTKIASYIIREIFNHHLESFLPGDKTLPCTMEQIYQQRAIDPKQRESSFIVNSAVFLEEVISELLCKILCIFSYVLATENPCKAKANVTDIVTRLVKSIVLEFTTSQILVADHLNENLYFSEVYKEMVKKTVNIIYEKILDDYQSLFHIYRAIQDDAVSFGEKIYHLLLGEIYDYQVESLVLGKLETSSYSSLQEENIIRNVLNTINNDSHDLPSCITVLPCSLLENMIYKLLAHMFPSPETEIEPNEEEVPPDYEFVNAASKLTDDIIAEISEHEIRFAEAEEHGENLQLGASDDFVDSICNNIIKKIKFEDEVQKDAYKRGSSFLGRIAGFIMKEIMDHHLQPFLCDEKSFPSDLPRIDDVIELLNPIKEKIQSFPQTSVYSATFLEDVVIDLVHKFYTLPRIAENPKDKEISERSIMGLAIKFANVLIGEFRKSEIKVLTNAEKMFSFPPVDKETVDKVCDSVYDEVTEIYGSKNVQKHDRSNTVIEMVAALTKKAISAFKIQPLFSGGWSSTLFSFLDVDSIMQRIQHLPNKTFTRINRSLKENPVSSLEQFSTLIPLTSDLKNKMDTLEIDGRAVNGKENFKKKTLMKTGSIQQPICINISSSMKSKVTTIALESFGGMAKKKKGDEKKKETSIGKDENISKLTSTTTSVKSKDTLGPDLGTAFTKNEIKKKDRVSRKDEKGRGDELYQHLSPAMDDIKNKVVLGPGFEICGKKSDKKKGSSLGKGDIPLELPSLTSNVRNTEIQEKRRDSPAYPATNDKKILHSKHAQNVPVSIYRNVLETSSLQGPVDDLNYPSLLGENAAYVTQACGKDFAQHASVNSAKQNAPPKDEESEIQRQPRKWDNPQNLLENKPRIFPANFLEDVISEIVNKLIFSSSLDTYDACQNVTNDVNPAELHGMAMKLTDSLLKEFSDAQIKVLNPDQGIKFLPSEDNISAVHKAPLRQKELSVVKRPSKKKIIMDNIPPIHNMASATKIPSSDQTPFMAKIPSIDKMLVNKVVHSSICNILQDYRSQDSICEDINFNVEKLAKRLANAVIEEILQYQLNLLLYDEVSDSKCLPLESTKVMKKVHKVAQTACKECQTSSPYTIMLPYEFLERIISSLLSRIFSTVANAKTEMSEDNLYTELDFLQMKLASTVKTEISKDEDMIIQYVKSLHPNDDEIIQLVVQTVYNNLLPQFGSQENIRKCISSGCKILSEAIVNLVVQEVTGNQLQNYFSGELTPLQCTEIDSTIENILRGFLMVKEISNSEFHPQEQEETSSSELVLEAVKIMEKVAKIIDDLKSKKKPPTEKEAVLDARFLEEILALFLAKLAKLPSASSKDAENLSKPELNKIASQLTKSMTAEISRKNISIIAANPEEYFLNPESIEIISQMVDSVYNCVLQQSGTHEELYHDMKDTNHIFPKEVASLIIRKVSSCPLAMISSGDPCANLFGDLDIDRIVEKVHEHAIKIEPGLEQKGLDQGLRQEELSVRIIPHLGKEPINIDPDIVAEHLGVISIKTQSLKKLQTECLTRTGHSIETLRRASINGKRYSTEITAAGNRKKEKRISLDQMGRLNVKPLEASSRNSFQSLIKPDITKVELLKDVQSKKDLIIRLITHDISQENLENKEESLASDEDEVVLQEVIKEEEFPESPLEDQVKEDMNLTTSTVAHPKPPISKCSLKKFLSVGKCQPKSSVTIIPEVSPAKQTEYEQTLRSVSSIDVTTSKCLTVTNSPWEKKTQLSETEMRPSTEPTHHFIHRMMSASSYNEEDLPSFTSFDDERSTDPSAKVTEDFEKPHTSSRQGSEMMRKISSTFSKVFSRSNTGVPKTFSPSPPHQDRK
ncbi:hypothetical protein MJG53_020048 [Ovis ammon polii x Ovis aries]|uniref:Uncharacterized protein n=1 Tax=Ovis ammon polii x Ovis aries TaxID=2918886 RepID=A0ACB9U191_9CETA|nr:hypothetical protein MJG53_020048 [Ovis ammon polii x Ovis aries]